MELALDHLQAHWKIYLLIAACVVPQIVIFRRFALPAIQYLLETTIYIAVMHGVVGAVVRLCSWFKDQSTMKRARDLLEASYDPGWSTPWSRFWDHRLYDPHWIFYFELALAAGIMYAVWRFRPLYVQRPKKKAEAVIKKINGQYVYQGKAKVGGAK